MISMTLGSRYEVKLNEVTKEYEYFDKGILIPRTKDTLYKYLCFNDNTIASLMGCYFWLANPFSFNDPFDCNKNLIVDYAEDPAKIAWDNRNHFDDIGIISFSEERCHPLMWAHYTNNYNGLIIEFDPNYKNFLTRDNRIQNLRWRKVMYPDYLGPMQKGFPFAEEVMLTSKLPYWEYENEWRLIGNLTNEDNRFLHFYPLQIKRFYIGYNLFKNNGTALQILTSIRDAHYSHADVWWVRPSSNKYGAYEVRKIDLDSIEMIKL